MTVIGVWCVSPWEIPDPKRALSLAFIASLEIAEVLVLCEAHITMRTRSDPDCKKGLH